MASDQCTPGFMLLDKKGWRLCPPEPCDWNELPHSCRAEAMGLPLIIIKVAGKTNLEQYKQTGAERVLLPEH